MQDIAVLFAGDFCPINRTEQLVLKGKPDLVFGDLLPELHSKDLSIVNLECPLTTINAPIPKTGPNLKAHPKVVDCIKAGSFDVVNLANNHIADYGSFGLNETMLTLQSNKIDYVGAGPSLSIAQKPLQVNCKGRSIAFLAFAENEFSIADENQAGAWPLDPVVNIAQIKEAKASNHMVVVLVHGGDGFNPIPSPRVVKTYRAFVDAGASAVIASHPHVPQGYEIYNHAPIFYSLGNFVFDLPEEDTPGPLWSRSFIVRLQFQGNEVKYVDTFPYKALARTGCLTLLKGEELDEFVAYLRFLCDILKNDSEIMKYWNGWCALMGPEWFRSLSFSSPLGFVCSVSRWRPSRIMKYLLRVRNLITCEAHHDLLSTYLDLIRKNQLNAAREYVPLIRALQKGEIPGSSHAF